MEFDLSMYNSSGTTPEPQLIGGDDPVFKKLSSSLTFSNPAYQPRLTGPAKPLVEIKAPEPFGLHETNFYRYARRPEFNELGFTPYADNETLYNDNSTALSEIGRGLQGMLLNTASTFADGFEGTYDLITGNFSNMFKPDVEAAKNFENINRIYGSTEGGLTGFIANNAINMGFATGMIAQAFVESALISAATGNPITGAGSFLSKLGVGAKTLSTGVKSIDQVGDITSAAKVLNNISNSSPNWVKTGLSGMGNTVMPNVTQYIDDAFTAAKAGTEIPGVGRGAAAFLKEVQTLNFAATEAQLEGGFVETELYNGAVDKFYEQNGYMPDDETLARIREKSQEGGQRALMANLPVIYLTDAVVLKPLLSMGKTASRITGLGEGIGSSIAERGIRQTAEGTFEVMGKGLKESIKSLGRPSTYYKLGRNSFLPAISEGGQEVFQEIVSQSYKDYYSNLLSDPLNIPYEDMAGTFSGAAEILNLAFDPSIRPYAQKAASDQYSAKGLETFISGAFIGGVMGPAGSAVAKLSKMATAKGRKEIQLLKEQEEATKKQIVDTLNTAYSDVYKLFNPRLKNYKDVNNLLKDYQEAELSGDEKRKKDIAEELRFTHLMTVLQTGQLDNFKTKLQTLQSLDDKGISEATGIEDPKEARTRLEETVKYADSLEGRYKEVEKKYGNPFRTDMYNAGTEEYNNTRVKHYAYEQAKRDLIFLSDAADKTKERIESLRSNISKNNSSGKITALDIDILTSSVALNDELRLLEKEVLADAQTPEQKQLLKEKKTRYSSLLKYKTAYEQYLNTLDDKSKGAEQKRVRAAEKLKKTHSSFTLSMAKMGTPTDVDLSKVEDDFTNIIDSISLNKDKTSLIAAINNLNNPIKLSQYAVRNANIINDVIINKRAYYKQSLDFFLKNVKKNQLIKEIYDLGFIIGIDELKELSENNKIPSKIYNVKTKEAVDINDPSAAKVKELLEDYGYTMDAKPETKEDVPGDDVPTDNVTPSPKEEIPTVADEFKETPDVKEEEKPQEKIYQYSELPEALKKIVNDRFNEINNERRIAGEPLIGSVRQFTTLPFVQTIIKDWFASKPASEVTSLLQQFKDKVNAATTADELFDVDQQVATSDLTDEEISEISDLIDKKRSELGLNATGMGQTITPEEKKAVENSMAPTADVEQNRANAARLAKEQDKESLDNDFFSNIDEC